jgi:hypothetical protein
MKFNPRAFVIGISIAALLGGLISYFSGFGFWPAFAISVFALLINGIIATVEDEMPGGFNNPDKGNQRKQKRS